MCTVHLIGADYLCSKIIYYVCPSSPFVAYADILAYCCSSLVKMIFPDVSCIAELIIYSRMSKIETADLSQFRAYCLFHRNSSTAAKNN